MKRDDFDRAQNILANIRESEKEVNKLIGLLDQRRISSNRQFINMILESYQCPGLLEKLADIVEESIKSQIHSEQDNVAHLNSLFDSL